MLIDKVYSVDLIMIPSYDGCTNGTKFFLTDKAANIYAGQQIQRKAVSGVDVTMVYMSELRTRIRFTLLEWVGLIVQEIKMRRMTKCS